MSETVAIVPAGKYAVAEFDPASLREIVTENTGGDRLDIFQLDQVKVPAGGVTTWSVPDITAPDGVGETKEIVGVIVCWENHRGYWAESIDDGGGGKAPDCRGFQTENGWVGVGTPGGDCASCPFAQWGSGRNGQGVACGTKRRLFVLREGDILPIVISVPTMSEKNISSYLFGLVKKRLPYHGAVTRFSLNRTKNAKGTAYAEIVPSFVAEVPLSDRGPFTAYKEMLKATIEANARAAMAQGTDSASSEVVNAEEYGEYEVIED